MRTIELPPQPVGISCRVNTTRVPTTIPEELMPELLRFIALKMLDKLTILKMVHSTSVTIGKVEGFIFCMEV